MHSEKDLWDSLPRALQSSLEPILDRYQRHLMLLEAEVAELKNALPQLQTLLQQRSQTPVTPPSTSIGPRQSRRRAEAYGTRRTEGESG